MEYVVARVDDQPFEFEEFMQTRWVAHSMCKLPHTLSVA